MKKLLLGLSLFVLGLSACGYKDAMAYHVETVTPVEIKEEEPVVYNALNYNKLYIYLYGNQIDSWYHDTSGTWSRMLQYHNECTLTIKDNLITIYGDWKYTGNYSGPNTTADTYTIVYGGEGYSFKLNK